MQDGQSASQRRIPESISSSGFSFRTPITLLTVSFYVVSAGLVVFLGIGESMSNTVVLGALLFGLVTSVWIVGYRFFVPTRMEAHDDRILFETRFGGRREVTFSEFKVRLNRAGRLGSSLIYSPTTRPRRGRGVFLTYDQTEFVLRCYPELSPRR